ncbi:transcriptional regulator family: Fungal Specific TF [Aspergillus niger]|nr:transcriptional regulator family: Fungal Specific TF [Aspergillus niger]KAI2959082.1 transcriptional regulator family: Fungal Specific TF [Aspergillus niger]KAI2979217.1 transcriptional regulator family: Fungal Specific TF [Aspergillus niger]
MPLFLIINSAQLKCGRQRPVCARCQRVDATCSYPLPPNRRGPRPRSQRARLPERATERSHPQEHTRPRRRPLQQPYINQSSPLQQTSPSRIEPLGQTIVTRGQSATPNPVGFDEGLEGISHPRSDTAVNDASVVLASGTPVLLDSYPNQLRTMCSIEKATDSVHTPNEDQPPLPPTALGLSLLELYFTRIYNAPLLFHKSVLFQQYLEQKLHGALLRALLALATLFLQPCDSEHGKDLIGEHAELKVLSIYHSSGLPWAKAAEKEAIVAAVDSPSLMVIQALACLQHYWFGIGQPYRGNICLVLAYRACHLLGYTNNSNGVVGLDHDMSLESELARRCFWACWTSTCIVMEPEPYIKSSWQEVAMLPLPGEIRSTPSGYKIMLGETMDEKWTSRALTPAANSGSVPANLMKMVGVCGNYCRLHCRENLRSIQHKIYINRRIFKILISQHPAVKAKIPRRPPQDTLKSWSPQVKIQAPLLVC